MNNGKYLLIALTLIIAATLGGCASYTTPAAGVQIPSITDPDIAELLKVEPASAFPARLALVRVQAPGYQSRTNSGYGRGRFSVVTTRDIEEADALDTLGKLPQLSGVAPLGRLLLPAELNSLKDLRTAAAQLKADMLLIYTVDTEFNVEGTFLGPLSLVSLGTLPNKKVFVTATTSSMLVDVRTGFVYGVAESSAREEQRATMWSTEDAIDQARLRAEKTSFKQFVGEFATLWQNTIKQYAQQQSEVYRY